MLNPNEAPSDCIAIKAEGCRGCVFEDGINECSQKGPKIIPCVSDSRDDKTSVIFKLKQPQPDLLNAATHEQSKPVVTYSLDGEKWTSERPPFGKMFYTWEVNQPATRTISDELYNAFVKLLRAAEAEGDDCVPRSPRLTYAKNAVLRAGGGAK